jgi:hypothetical protein
MEPVRLATYQSCSFAEKRAVLQTFWSNHVDESDKVNRAADEYGPYAYAMVAFIAAELILISAVLLVRGSWWSGIAFAASAFALWCLWWTRRCQRARRSGMVHP